MLTNNQPMNENEQKALFSIPSSSFIIGFRGIERHRTYLLSIQDMYELVVKGPNALEKSLLDHYVYLCQRSKGYTWLPLYFYSKLGPFPGRTIECYQQRKEEYSKKRIFSPLF